MHMSTAGHEVYIHPRSGSPPTNLLRQTIEASHRAVDASSIRLIVGREEPKQAKSLGIASRRDPACEEADGAPLHISETQGCVSPLFDAQSGQAYRQPVRHPGARGAVSGTVLG